MTLKVGRRIDIGTSVVTTIKSKIRKGQVEARQGGAYRIRLANGDTCIKTRADLKVRRGK